MTREPDLTTLNTTFYPMAGGIRGQFPNLLATLRWIDSENPNPDAARSWMRSEFQISPSFARDVYTVLFISSGLITARSGICLLTPRGKGLIASEAPGTLFSIFADVFIGFAAALEVFRSNHERTQEVLVSQWHEIVSKRFPATYDWSQRTVATQLRHSIDWLRSLGFVERRQRAYRLTPTGQRLLADNPPEALAIQDHEIADEQVALTKLSQEQFSPFDIASIETVTRRRYVRNSAFRRIVMEQYDQQCAVCGFRLEAPRGVYESEAAHIIPKRLQGTDDPRNGICLCSTHHWAYDEGVIAVSPDDLSVMIAPYLDDLGDDESTDRLLTLRGRRVGQVRDAHYSPSRIALEWHVEHVFLA